MNRTNSFIPISKLKSIAYESNSMHIISYEKLQTIKGGATCSCNEKRTKRKRTVTIATTITTVETVSIVPTLTTEL
jgi:hypothetical protein